MRPSHHPSVTDVMKAYIVPLRRPGSRLPRTLLLVAVVLLGLVSLAGCQHTTSMVPAALDETDARGSESVAKDSTQGSGFEAGDVREITIPGTEVSFTLVYVPGGTYRIGTPATEEGRQDDEGPIRTVLMDGYWIGQYEVTDDEFSVFRYPDRDADTTAVPNATYDVDAVSRPSPPYEDPAFGMGGAGKPAVGMTQWGALQYAKWLTEKTNVFFRLPTEAEWEIACRAGAEPDISGLYRPQDLESVAWYEANSDLVLQSVGQKEANDWKLFDMLGNAAEWMLDEYVPDYHDRIGESEANPWIAPTRLHPRTVRGGDYGERAEALRCGARLESTTEWKRRDPQIPKSFWWNTDSPFVGFRLVVPAVRPPAEDEALFWMQVLGE